jgi:hypothetical protein
MTTVFNNATLLPSIWRTPERETTVRTFNPALLRDGSGWLLAYRVVCEPELLRQIAICRLDEEFRVIPGSQLPLTDWIPIAGAESLAPEASTWFADPRLYRFEGRIFLYWNSGWHEPQNYQFLQELDSATLRPVGSPRELVLRGTRQKLEKNWGLFENDGLYVIYSVNPHRVLAGSLAGEGAIQCVDAAVPTANAGGFARDHGGLRGGAPPQRVGDHYYSFCHSIENAAAGYRYVPSVYRFAAKFPFSPTDMPQTSLAFDIPAKSRRSLPKLNAAVNDVVYPAGAAFHDGKWVISFGIDDERCAVTALTMDEVMRTLNPVA